MSDPRAMETGYDADDVLAMDWALGALEGPARASAEARRQADPAFAALCQDWAERLAPMSDALAPVAPSAELWSRIDAAIGAEATVPVVVPAPAAAVAQTQSSWWGNLALWRGMTAAFGALAIGLLATRPDPVPAPPATPPAAPATAQLATVLAAEGGAPLVTIALDPDSKSAILAPVSDQDLEGRVPELWLIPADGTPRSLGVIDLGGTQRIAVPPTLLELVAEGAILAVSLEPVGGSPTGAPTGPVVATGKLSSI